MDKVLLSANREKGRLPNPGKQSRCSMGVKLSCLLPNQVGGGRECPPRVEIGRVADILGRELAWRIFLAPRC